VIAGDQDAQLALSMGVATALASVAYVSVFFMIAVLTRNSIIVGLLYALLWEGVLAGYVPGVRTVSVRQWALAPAEQMVEGNTAIAISSDVGLAAGLILLAAATIGSVVISIQRLKVLPVRVSD
jgi:ABC-2 type transport system permease protein